MKKLLLLAALSLTLFISACSTNSGKPDISNVQPGVFNSSSAMTFDWGDFNIQGPKQVKTFSLSNNEETPLFLSGAVTSCMCTTAVFTLADGTDSVSFGMHNNPVWSRIVMPGESFDVTVTFDPLFHGPDATGPIRRTVNVLSKKSANSKNVLTTRLDLSGNVLSEKDFKAKYSS